jgi:DNA invertase Pin-like site-specific DNA recombinase
MNVIGYARVSSRGQSYEIQEDEIKRFCKLKDYELVRLFADKKSGKNMDRTEFKIMMDMLNNGNPSNIEAIVTYKLDRIGRSIRDLINFTDWLDKNNIGFISISNNINTTTKEGRFYFYLMSSIAEYERELIMERTEAGRKKFVEDGGKLGRKEIKLSINEIRRQIAEGVPITTIAKRMKVNRNTIYKRLNDYNDALLRGEVKEYIDPNKKSSTT